MGIIDIHHSKGLFMSNWRNSSKYRHWRSGTIERDGKCMCCGSEDSLHAHHIEHATYNIDLRFELSNSLCLCRTCHTQFHTNYNRSYKQNCTRYQLDNFLQLATYFMTKHSEPLN